jgi:hypothetical protein
MFLMLVICLMAGILALALWSSEPAQTYLAQRESADFRDMPRLPMTFAHRDHGSQQCATCHHNYIDNTGHDLCLNCHLITPELTARVEQHFHSLCMGCHQQEQLQGAEKYGPVRACSGCHLEDDLP